MISTGGHLTILKSVDSTNNYAMAMVRTGLAKHGDGYFAMDQTQGRGQRGKAWATEPGTNIILTLAMQPVGLVLQQQFQLSMAIALAAHDFFSGYAGEETAIKWPNDIYWRDRKAGGILIETIVGSREAGAGSRESGVGRRQSEGVSGQTEDGSRELGVDSWESGVGSFESEGRNWELGIGNWVEGGEAYTASGLRPPDAGLPTADCRLSTPDSQPNTPDSNWRWAIIGMGININQTVFSENVQQAVSLKQITGKEYNVIALAEELCSCVQNRYKELLAGTSLLQPYNDRLYKKGQRVKFKKGGRVFEGSVKEVNLLGELVVMTATEEHFGFGEIEWVKA